MEDKPRVSRVFGSEPLRILAAVLLAFVLAQLGLVGLSAWRGVVSEAMLTPKQLGAYQGTGGAVGEDKAEFHANAQGQLIVITPDLKGHFNTRDYGAIRILGKGIPVKNASAILILPDRQKLPLKQSPSGKPGVLQFSIPTSPIAPLHGLALLFEGVQGSAPVVINSVRFEPRRPLPLLRAWKILWQDWLTPEGWQLYSVNFIKGGKVENLRSSPAVAGLLWFVLALLIWWGIRSRPSKIQPGIAVAVMGLLIWTVVDFRWQVDQWRSVVNWLSPTQSSHPAQSGRMAVLGQIDQVAQRLRLVLPDNPKRLFVVSQELLVRSRLRYDLLPMNGYSLTANLNSVVRYMGRGDYLILVQGGQSFQYDPVLGALVKDALQLPVTRLAGGSGIEVFRVDAAVRVESKK